MKYFKICNNISKKCIVQLYKTLFAKFQSYNIQYVNGVVTQHVSYWDRENTEFRIANRRRHQYI